MDFDERNRKRTSSPLDDCIEITGTTPATDTSSWKRSRIEERKDFTDEENEPQFHQQQPTGGSEPESAVASAMKTPALRTAKDNAINCEQNTKEDDPSPREHDEYSMENLLSVPLEFLFRQVGGASGTSDGGKKSIKHKTKTKKALLSRTEAHYLLRTSQLAYEIDILVYQIASKVLERQHMCRTLGQQIEQNANHPCLRPILSMLSIIGGEDNDSPSSNIQYIQQEMDRILYELASCAGSLRQLAEQNWTLADSLLDAFGGEDDDDEIAYNLSKSTRGGGGGPQELAKEKRKLGDIQEEVATRIEWVMTEMTMFTKPVEKGSSTPTNTTEAVAAMPTSHHHHHQTSGQECSLSISSLSMREFCNRLMGDLSEKITQQQQQVLEDGDGGFDTDDVRHKKTSSNEKNRNNDAIKDFDTKHEIHHEENDDTSTSTTATLKTSSSTAKVPTAKTTIMTTTAAVATQKKVITTTKAASMPLPKTPSTSKSTIVRESSTGSHSSSSSTANGNGNGKRSPVQAIASAVRAIESPYLLHNKNNNNNKENMSETSNSQNTNSQKSQTKLYSHRTLTNWGRSNEESDEQQQQRQHEDDHPGVADDILSSTPVSTAYDTKDMEEQVNSSLAQKTEKRRKASGAFVTAAHVLLNSKRSDNDAQSEKKTRRKSSSWYHDESGNDDDGGDDDGDNGDAEMLSKPDTDMDEEDDHCLQGQDQSNITTPSSTQVHAAEALTVLASSGDREKLPVSATSGEPTSPTTAGTTTTTHNYEYSY